jgi:hypothetical protein
MVKNNIKYKKSQSLSTDILVVVVIVLFGALFLVMNKINDVESGPEFNEKYELASQNAEIIVDDFKSKGIIDSENNVDLNKLILVDEASIREEFGIIGDFCIVFEKDGNLVKIDPENNVNGIGSEDIIVNGVPCK